MSLHTVLARAVEFYPPGSVIPLPVDTIKQWLNDYPANDPLKDFEVEEIADLEKRSPVTIRNWCRTGIIPGAYKLNKKTWKIPKASYQRFKENQQQPQEAPVLRLRKYRNRLVVR